MRTPRNSLKGAVVAAALVVAALAGAGQASAATLCSVNTNPCPAGNRYAANTEFNVVLSSPTYVEGSTYGGFYNPTFACSDSAFKFKNLAVSGNPVPAQLMALSYSNCGNSMGYSCTPTTSGLPSSASLTPTGSGKGTLTLNNVTITLTCDGMPVCRYTGSLSATMGGSLGMITMYQAGPLAGTHVPSGGFCPTGAQLRLSASYHLTSVAGSPTALWVQQSP